MLRNVSVFLLLSSLNPPPDLITGDLIFVEVKHWESAFSLVSSEYDDVATR